MDVLIERLQQGLAGGLPGEAAQYRMAPESRLHPRQPRPSPADRRHGAVLLYLYPAHGDWRIVLMKRPDYDGAHGGQVSIPGGGLESGENHVQAALREFTEETGVAVEPRQLLGELSELFIPTSNFLVRPFVAYALEQPRFSPDPVEVEEIIELPLPELLDEQTVRRGSVALGDGGEVSAPYFDVRGHVVWGATAMILSELKAVLRGTG